jgi:ribonuclease E
MAKPQKMMMINVTHAEESRVAVVADGVLDTFEIETVDRQALKGNLYKGKLESVHSGLQAAFVDIGMERAGFLPLDEVNFEVNPVRKGSGNGRRIEDHLQKGEDVLVQVVKDAYGTKPPTLSTYYSLPGRYMVITPYQKTEGISRKLGDKERERIKKMFESFELPEHMGTIVRTAGGSQTKAEIQRDLLYLLRLWDNIESASKREKGPCLVYQERDLALRTIRDLLTSDIDEGLVDDPKTYEEILDFIKTVMPQKQRIVKLYQGGRPIYNKHNLEEQIENIFKRRVPLPSGGALIFDQTEALTAVDVNSGKMTKGEDIEDIAVRANTEAAEEIARQLRLRDLGGLVVIDFIDMRPVKNIRAVEKAMRDALRKDKARHDVTRMSRLGLMEISRQRLRAGKASARYMDCPACEGMGSIKTIEAAALQALRKVQTRVVRGDLEKIELLLPTDVAAYVQNQKRAELASLEKRYRTSVLLLPQADYGRDDLSMQTTLRTETDAERSAVPLVGDDALEKIEAQAAAEAREAERGREVAEAREAERGREVAEAREPERGPVAAAADQEREEGEAETNEDGSPRRRRRRRRRRKPAEEGAAEAEKVAKPADPGPSEAVASSGRRPAAEASREDRPRAGSGDGRRRRRRGGRGRRGSGQAKEAGVGAAKGDGTKERPQADLPLAVPEPSRRSAEAPKEKKARSSWWARLTGSTE